MGLGASEKPGKEVWMRELEVGGNYVQCLDIVVIFMGLGGAKRWKGDNFWSQHRGKLQSGGPNIMWVS